MKKILIILVLGIFTLYDTAFCQVVEVPRLLDKLSEISRITNDSLRLVKYDSLVSTTSKSFSKRKGNITGFGDWSISREKNPLDDSNIFNAVVRASEGENSYGEKPVLIVRCNENKLNVIINWDEYLGRDASVTYRVGDGEAIKKNWLLSTSSEATFYPGDSLTLLEKMSSAKTLVAKIVPYNSNPITAIFSIKGSNKLYQELSNCKSW